MDGAGPGRAGRLALFLGVMNVALLASGLALEHWLRQPRGLPEFNAQHIRLLTQPEASGAKRAKAPVAETPSAAALPVACLKINSLDQSRYTELLAMLDGAGIPAQRRQFVVGQTLGWWVFWPPEYEALQREKALRAIRAAGIEDFLPIVKGSMAQAISLGVFAGEDQARIHRNRLRSRGLDKAEYGPRPGVAESPSHLVCMLQGPEQLEKLKTALPAGVSVADRGECPDVQVSAPAAAQTGASTL